MIFLFMLTLLFLLKKYYMISNWIVYKKILDPGTLC